MSLICSGLIPLLHPGLWWCPQHLGHSHCSGHWGLLLEHLEVGCTVPYHHNYVLATFLQLSVCILDGKTLG